VFVVVFMAVVSVVGVVDVSHYGGCAIAGGCGREKRRWKAEEWKQA
jgi:hypothetical protein